MLIDSENIEDLGKDPSRSLKKSSLTGLSNNPQKILTRS